MSDLNGLPQSWVEVTIAELLQPLEDGRILHHGWSPQCEKDPSQSHEEWGVLKTTAVQDGLFLWEHNKRLPPTLAPRPQLEVKAGDILITCAGPRSRCGVPCLVRQTRARLILSGKMYRFRVKDSLMTPAFLECYLRARNTQTAIDRMKTGISDSGLNLTHARFLGLKVPLAPINEQLRIIEKIDELFSKLDAGVTALERVQIALKRYRAAVLKAAVEGQLTAAWRAKHPDSEPASELLQRILSERRRKWEQVQRAKYKEPAGPEKEKLLTLPKGWC